MIRKRKLFFNVFNVGLKSCMTELSNYRAAFRDAGKAFPAPPKKNLVCRWRRKVLRGATKYRFIIKPFVIIYRKYRRILCDQKFMTSELTLFCIRCVF